MLSTIETAKLWLSRGISPIPLLPKSKMPMFHWKKWATELPTEKHLAVWFNNKNNNIAICCGMSNLVVIDFDDMDKFREWIFRLEDTVWFDIFLNTYSVQTSRGIHIYLYCDKLPHKHTVKEKMIDIKSSGFVLVPPSIHPSGTLYKENNNKAILRVATLDDLFPHEFVTHKCDDKCVIADENSWDVRIDENSIGIEDIKKISMLTVAQWYTHMSPMSNQYWIGCCPGHDDKHPSFHVDIVNNKCFCHSTRCKLNGDYWLDTLDFYALIEGIDKKEAFKQLRKVIIR